MRLIAIITLALLCTISTQAKTYTIGSGKWTDPEIWGCEYIGPTIKADDVVIITGQITLNTLLVVHGTIQVEIGASIVGMKDLYVAKGGVFINRGNTVVRSITNEGTIKNYLAMESMSNIQNIGNLENNNYVLAGTDFETRNGNTFGKGGRVYANNAGTVYASRTLPVARDSSSVRKKK
jgi:hypothetical protein